MAMKQAPFRGIIEEPNPYATPQTWEQHLAKIEAMNIARNNMPNKATLLRRARKGLALAKRWEREYGPAPASPSSARAASRKSRSSNA